jgi:hypothetical protein
MTAPTHPHDHSHTSGPHAHPSAHGHASESGKLGTLLGWPAWLRVVAVLPVVVALWLAVIWAGEVIAPW